MDGPPPMCLEDVLDWLDGMSAVDQIRTCKLLADTRTASELSARAHGLIFVLSRSESIEKVAAALGVHRSTVEQAITQHRRRERKREEQTHG